MKKILTIAFREYKAMVGTKTFLLSIIMMPVLMGGGLVALQLLNNVGEIKERDILIADATGQIYPVLEQAAEARNAMIDKQFGEDGKPRDGESDFGGGPSFNKAEKFYLTAFGGEMTEEKRLEFSDKIRSQELYGFLEIPREAIEQDSTSAASANIRARFFSQDSGLSPARGWLQSVISEAVKNQRLVEAEIDVQLVAKASQPVRITGVGLVERASDGSISEAEEKDELTAIFLPMGVMMLMFMVIFMASQPMLESVLEEKSQRIAEVLLGSANPFQLMCGKLLGSVAGSVTIFAIYAVGLYFVADQRGYLSSFPFEILPWFVLFQILGVLFYASIFLAVGASVTQLKEAQSLLLPVWMLLMSPLFVWIFIVQDPTGSVATWFSLFPPATPTTMMLRLATGQTIPIWQPILGALLTSLATLSIVVLAGRIFRVGILWQGKTPKLSEIIKWGLSG
ncbi:MAG: ABC transporter permease [Planctomycetota bacterium]